MSATSLCARQRVRLAAGARMLLWALLLALPATAVSQPVPPRTEAASSAPAAAEEGSGGGPTDAVPAFEAIPRDAALAAYVQGLVEATLAHEGIPGMLVAVVQGDQVLLARGYGMAQLDPQRPADGEHTLFRIGSVSKTFTYTALMQLVEQGRVALEDPIDRHLPGALHVPDEGFGPLRVRHLLTHTAGFEDTALGHLFKQDPARVERLEDYLVRWRPRRVRAPDTAAVYSNYGVALLGALVAHVSGMPFEEYVEQRITGPLGMHHTTFREPLADARRVPERLAALIAPGYQRRQGGFVRGGFEHIAHGAPAGSASSSAADMARWMRMHLAEGRLDGVQVLAPETASAMRGILFANAEGTAGIAHGFLTGRMGDVFAYGHGGATLHFHTAMHLLPGHELGVFVSANSDNARTPVRRVAQLLVEHLLPADPQHALAATPPAPSATELQRYAGRYASNRRPYRSVEKLLLVPGNVARVVAAPDGTLRVLSGAGATRYLAQGGHHFRAAEGGERLVFRAAADGTITGYVADPGIAVMERLGPLHDPNTLALLLTAAAAVSLLRLLGALRGHRRYHHRTQPARPGLPAVKALSLLSASLWLAFIGSAMYAVLDMLGQGNALLYSYPSRTFLLALALATAAALATVLELLALLPVWRSRWQAWPRLRHTLAVLLLAATVVVMWQWNLVGMRV